MRKTKLQLVEELEQLRRRVAELEAGGSRAGAEASAKLHDTALFRAMVENANDIIYTIDADHTLLYVSPNWTAMLGHDPSEVVGATFMPRIHPDDLPRCLEFLQTVRETGEQRSGIEYRVQHQDGSWKWHMSNVSMMTTPAGDQIYTGIARDISERKQFEDDLRESRSMLQAVMDNASTVIFIKDVAGRYLLINKRYEELFGVANEAIVGQTDFAVFPADAAARFQAADRKAIEAGGPIVEEEVVPHDDGPHTYISVKFPMYGADGEPYATCGIATDITKRKQAEQELERHHEELERRVAERTRELTETNRKLHQEVAERELAEEHEAIFRRFAEASGQGFGMADLDGTTTYLNPELCRMLELERPEDGYGKPIHEFHPDDSWRVLRTEALPRVMDRGEWNGETALVSRTGKVTPVIQSLFLVRDSRGNPIKLASVLTDITEREQAERALAESEAKYRALFENSVVGQFRVAIGGKMLDANHAMAEMFGWDDLQEFVEECHMAELWVDADDRAQMYEIMKAVGELENFETRFYRKDGSTFPLRVSSKMYPEFGYQEGICIDISEEQEAQEALEKSERMFRALTESMQAMVLITSIDQARIIYANAAAVRGIGYNLEELTGKDAPQFMTEETLRRLARIREAYLNGEEVPPTVETAIITKSGEERVFESSWAVIDVPGEGLLKVTVSFDITDRKRTEQALKESERKFRAVADTTSAIIMMAGGDGRIFFANRAAEEATGYTLEELAELEPMVDLFSMPGKEEWFREEVERAARTGEKISGVEMLIKRKDGEERWLEASGRFIELGGQLVDLSTSFDITERKRGEVALKESEKKFRALADSTTASIAIVVGEQPRFAYANQTLLDRYKLTFEELAQLDPAASLTPAARVAGARAAAAALERGDSQHRFEYQDEDGRWFEVNVAETEVDGEPGRIYTSFDITEHKLAQQALAESERKFRGLAESTAAQITILQDDRYVYANQAFLDYYELEAEDLPRINPEDVMLGTMDQETIRQATAAWQEAQERGDKQFAFEYPDTERNWFQANVTEMELLGRPAYMAMTIDITELKRAQEALAESEQRYRTIFDAAATAMISCGDDAVITLANDEWVNLTGYSKEETEGQLTWMPFFTGETLERMQRYHERRSQAPKSAPRFYEARLIDRFGEPHDGIVTVDVVPGTRQRVASFQDITELKRAQEELAESERRYRTIFDTAGTGMISFGADSVITLANEEWAKLSGYSLEETIGKLTWRPFFTERSLAKMRTFHEMRTRDPGSVPTAYEAEFVDRAGKIHEGIINIQVVPGTQQRVASFQDMTALKRAQNEMYRADKMAALGQIIAGVAHEINNPNNFIYFNLPILRKYVEAMAPLLEERRENDPDLTILNMPYEVFLTDVFKLLENMEHGSMRITSIVSDLKNYVRDDEDHDLKTEQVGPAVARVMTLVGKQVRKMVKRFDVEVAEGLPAVRMNAGKIEQVLINLVINAGQAVDKDDSWVKLTARRAADSEAWVELLVEDNGAGIPPENLEQIFEPFFTSKGRDQGTGLGLSISHRIVEEHGGRIDVASRIGEGTVFTIRLPAVHAS